MFNFKWFISWAFIRKAAAITAITIGVNQVYGESYALIACGVSALVLWRFS